jgi:hypothetical protein
VGVAASHTVPEWYAVTGQDQSAGDNETQLRQRVADFVYRCGRVLAVPAAGDRELLLRAHAILVATNDDGVTELWKMLPPEMELDALAARARPLFLADRCSYRTGLSALRRLVVKLVDEEETANAYRDAINDLRDGWKAVLANRRYWFGSQPVDGSEPAQKWTSDELAHAWLYGDLVHADGAHGDTATRRERYVAGWDIHADIIDLARTSVAFVKGFDAELGLNIPVRAYETDDLPSGKVRLGAMATLWAAEDGADQFDEVWNDGFGSNEPPAANYAPFELPKAGEGFWMNAFPTDPSGDQASAT